MPLAAGLGRRSRYAVLTAGVLLAAAVLALALHDGGVLAPRSLDGFFNGSFPTTASPSGQPYDFIQNLGFESLQAPSITM